MDIRLRLVPVLALLGLIIARAVDPTILGSRVVDSLPFTWWWAIFVPLFWLSAILISPPFVKLLVFVGSRWFLPPIVFVVLLVGLLWLGDVTWNHVVLPMCEPCGEAHLLPSATTAVFGGGGSSDGGNG